MRHSDFSSLHGVKPYSYQKQKFEKQKDDTKELVSHTQHSNLKNDLKIMLKRFKISKCLRYFELSFKKLDSYLKSCGS